MSTQTNNVSINLPSISRLDLFTLFATGNACGAVYVLTGNWLAAFLVMNAVGSILIVLDALADKIKKPQ